MKEFEVIHEIPNSCGNNQMRDVFFDEVECDSPVNYVRSLFPGKTLEFSEDKKADGGTAVFVFVDEMIHKFLFTEI